MTLEAFAPPSVTRLMSRLTASGRIAALESADAFERFAAEPGNRVALLTDDPVRVPETWDVAVILPEVLKELPDLHAAALSPEISKSLAGRYGISRWPALVFFRDGGFVGVLEGMRDWSVYRVEVPAMMARPISRPPGIGIPVSAVSSTCH